MPARILFSIESVQTMERFSGTADNTLFFSHLLELFLSLIEICDSFDQLGKIALICDLLYSPTDPEHKPLFNQIEKTARHLRGLPSIGALEVKQ